MFGDDVWREFNFCTFRDKQSTKIPFLFNNIIVEFHAQIVGPFTALVIRRVAVASLGQHWAAWKSGGNPSLIRIPPRRSAVLGFLLSLCMYTHTLRPLETSCIRIIVLYKYRKLRLCRVYARPKRERNCTSAR